MKTLHLIRILLAVAFTFSLTVSTLWATAPAIFSPSTGGRDSIAHLIQITEQELHVLQQDFFQKSSCLLDHLEKVNYQLLLSRAGASNYIALLEEKVQLQDELRLAEADFQLQMLKTRYVKGMELIKLLYEKVLALDHHFTSLQTVQNVTMLSNPNNFPEFQKNKEILEERLKKKSGVTLPALLQNNVYLSASFSLVSALFGEGDVAQKEKDLEQISCILDFTLRMNNDLNTIFYETEYLRQNNEALKGDCISLFSDYTKPVSYLVNLDNCRKQDDWEAVQESIEKTFKQIEAMAIDPNQSKQSIKMQINLGFAIDRLMDYINKYSAFVSQGEKYYQKFFVIINNYQNEEACSAQLPRQYGDLKKDIESSIEKFNNSYKLSEIKGSKLKELLYGMPE